MIRLYYRNDADTPQLLNCSLKLEFGQDDIEGKPQLVLRVWRASDGSIVARVAVPAGDCRAAGPPDPSKISDEVYEFRPDVNQHRARR